MTPASLRTRTTVVVAAACLGVQLSACSGPAPDPPEIAAAEGSGLAFVVGAHANAPAPELRGDIPALVTALVRAEGSASVVVASSPPQVEENGPVRLDCNSEPACVQRTTAWTDRIAASVRGARASTPESDLLESIELGAATLRSLSGPKTLVVIDSGLQTAGALRFQDGGLLDADPDEVAEYLASADAVPDLRGMTVVFSGIGDVASPQQILRTPQKRNLRDIWTTIARRGGAADVRVVDDPLTAEPAPGLPPVTVVPVPAIDPATCLGALRDTDVAFLPDTASLADPAAAAAALDPLARCLIDLGRPVTLTGTTSSAGTPDGQQRLSAQRAETIKVELARRGVPTDAITTRGLGFQQPPCVPDRDAAGALLPGPAAQNRQVIVEPHTP